MTWPMTGRWCMAIGGAALAVVALAVVLEREDILRTALDPKTPYQVYQPPAAPDYSKPSGWALLPLDPKHWSTADAPADVFFIHPTTYDGGRDWNAAIDRPAATRMLFRTMLPNYAGPFFRIGRVFAPRYRQASLYAYLMTLRDDAQEARQFAYGDVLAAFTLYLTQYNSGRPLVLVGVEQGGELAARLLSDVVAKDPSLVKRLAGVYLIETVVPADAYGPAATVPACERRHEARCVVAWTGVRVGDDYKAKHILERALVWTSGGRFQALGDRHALCVNPLTGAADDTQASDKLNLGAANASGLEWGVRPAFLPKQVSARCAGGLLRTSVPSSPSLRFSGSWADRYKVNPYNVFYADIEADARARVAALLGLPDVDRPAPPMDRVIEVRRAPIHRVD